MISFQDADVIVQESIRTVSPISSIDSDTPLRDLGLDSTQSLDSLKAAIARRVSQAPSLDLQIGFPLHTGMVVRDLIHTLQLSTRKLCSNANFPHPQPCCPYPATCGICGRPVI